MFIVRVFVYCTSGKIYVYCIIPFVSFWLALMNLEIRTKILSLIVYVWCFCVLVISNEIVLLHFIHYHLFPALQWMDTMNERIEKNKLRE